ncbi:MAG: alpha/beta fold hydrolase [Maricaulaceae bacterium]
MKIQPTYILIHGSGLGGWCWDRVKDLMVSQGANVYAPTFPSTSETIEAYVAYIVDLIHREDLRHCVLVGHSYGGMVVTGVADRVRENVQRVIYLDAAVPNDGDDFASHIPNISKRQAKARRSAFRALSQDGIWINPPAPQLAGVSDPDDIDYVNKYADRFPLQTWLDPLRLARGGVGGLDKTYILAVNPRTDIMGYPQHGAIAKRSNDWRYREINCGHAAMIIDPKGVAALLLE